MSNRKNESENIQMIGIKNDKEPETSLRYRFSNQNDLIRMSTNEIILTTSF
jgi:hypothetical protein